MTPAAPPSEILGVAQERRRAWTSAPGTNLNASPPDRIA